MTRGSVAINISSSLFISGVWQVYAIGEVLSEVDRIINPVATCFIKPQFSMYEMLFDCIACYVSVYKFGEHLSLELYC